MKHFLILSSLFILITQIIFTENAFASRTVTTSRPYYRPYNTYYGYNNPYYDRRHYYPENFTDMNALEEYAFSKTYPRENFINRLQRLENQAFGAIQEGDVYNRYENVRAAILSRPKQNYKTSVLRSIGDYFSGQMTGFTPSIQNSNSSFSYFPSSYGNTFESGYTNPWGSRYHVNNYGTGSYSGVRILD